MTNSRSIAEEKLAALWFIAASVSSGWLSKFAWVMCLLAIIPAMVYAVKEALYKTSKQQEGGE